MVYVASKWGNEYHNLTENEALGGGSAGPGKSMVLLFDAIPQLVMETSRTNLSETHPQYLRPGMSEGWALHLRRTFGMLDTTLARAKKMFPQIDPEVRWVEREMTFHFPRSGFRYQFGHCQERGDWEKYFSNQYTYIGFDEVNQFFESQYTQIKSRCRTSDMVLRRMLKVRSMSNPIMKRDTREHFQVDDPFWVRTYFVDPCPSGRRVIRKKLKRRSDGTTFYRTRVFLPALLTDNPDPDFARQYEESLLDMPTHMRRALLDGDWYVTVGSHYSESWNSALHVCEPFSIPSGWRRARSMDWGYKKHGCVHWWAIDDEGTAFAEKELSFKGKTATEVALLIREIERKMGLWSTRAGDGGRSLISGPADTQLWEERGEGGKTKASQMAAVGVYWRKAHKKSRRTNSEKFMERLKDHAHGTQAPGIVFFNTCKNAIKTIPGIQSDVSDPDTPADGGEDHWHDSVLYFCADESMELATAPKEEAEEYDDEPEAPDGHPSDWGY